MPDSEKKTIQGSRTSFQTRHLTKILIFTAAVGGGHEAVGQAVRAELERAGHSVVMADGLQRMSRVLDWLLVRGYSSQVKNMPKSLDIGFAVTSRRAGAMIVQFFVGLLFASRLLKVVHTEQPDLVVSTYPLVTAALGRSRKKGKLQVPAVAVVPDYGVHSLWVVSGMDMHLVASRHSAGLVKRTGGRVSPTRLPVAPSFYMAPARGEARATLGLPQEAFVALVTGGAWGVGDLEGATRCAIESGAYAVVVTGENAELEARLKASFRSEENVRILGWSKDMPVLMAAADCLIHSASAMTCLEAIEMNLPILIFDPIFGHGELNARIMEQAGVARWARTAEELGSLLRSATQREISLHTPNSELAAPRVSAILGPLAGSAPQPVHTRRLVHPRSVLAGVAVLVFFFWLAFASPGIALAEKLFHLHVPGYDPSPDKVSLGVRVSDPATAAALESSAQQERTPVTVFATARGAEGLHPASGLTFGVAEEPNERLFSPWKERSEAQAAAAAIQRATGSYPKYFLPSPRTNLAALADAPPHTRLVIAEQTGQGKPQPGLLIMEASNLSPEQARIQFKQALQEIDYKGLRCVPLAEL
jgi:UDP-N-acetylglucosamine:LPS N-acetylglucosamine transferase